MDRRIADRLREVVGGDRRAKAWFYDTFAPQLFRRLRQRYGIPLDLDPEELLQDAFLYFLQDDARVLARFVDRFPGSGADELARYLWDLACGVASNRLRRRRNRRAAMRAAPQHIAIAKDPEGRRIDQDTIRRLEECIRGHRDRVFLYYKLRFVDGLTPEEIARTTGWSRRVTYRLRQQLNEAISECAQRLGIEGS